MDRDDAQSVADQAVKWFVVLRDDEVTEEDRNDFARWFAADPSHEAAWRSTERMWGGLDAVASRSVGIKPANLHLETTGSIASLREARPGRYVPGWKAMAAAAVLLVTLGIGWHIMPIGMFADYRTAVGERRTVTLQDGSQIELGTAAAVDVVFSERERRIKLLAGEAFFTVTKDPKRPFVVAARNGEVKVLGTAFDVKIRDGVTVAVAEHTVQVGTTASQPVSLTEGRAVYYDATGISAVTAADLDTIQAWRQDQLVFRDVPLNDVLAELQRYRYGHITLLDKSLGQRRVTAVFDARRTDAALDTIAQSLSLQIYRATGLLIIVAPN